MATRRPAPRLSHPPDRGRVPGLEDMLARARRVTDVTGCPVVGGIAVALHGWGRYTRDIDIYSPDLWTTHEQLEAAGIMWDAQHREHHLDGIPIHMVREDSLGGPPERTSTIEGIKVISLKDLIRGKLTLGLEHLQRSKDLADVVELIRRVPLKKDFAPKLPPRLRAPFKALVDQVHEPRRTPIPTLTFRKRYAS